MANPANGHLSFVRLTSPAAVRRFLRSLPGVPSPTAEEGDEPMNVTT
jgi:hypothetical protein